MKKQILAQDAFKLYAEKFMSLEDIARQLHLNERTLRRWKKSDDWETKRTEYLRTKTTLHSDLYDFTRSLINSIEKDMESNGKVEPARYYAVTKMLKLIGIFEHFIRISKQLIGRNVTHDRLYWANVSASSIFHHDL